MLYEGEISLHFDPPSRHSCHTRSPLLWTLIRISASGLSRYSEIHLTTVSWLTLGNRRTGSTFTFISNGPAQAGLDCV